MGGKVQGCLIVRPTDGPIASIQKTIIPVYLKEIKDQYQVVSSEELPKLSAQLAPIYNHPGQPEGTITPAKSGQFNIPMARARCRRTFFASTSTPTGPAES